MQRKKHQLSQLFEQTVTQVTSSLALIDPQSDNPQIKYVFDVTGTRVKVSDQLESSDKSSRLFCGKWKIIINSRF